MAYALWWFILIISSALKDPSFRLLLLFFELYSFFWIKIEILVTSHKYPQLLNLNKCFFQFIYGIKNKFQQYPHFKINQNEPSRKLINDTLYWANFRLQTPFFLQKDDFISELCYNFNNKTVSSIECKTFSILIDFPCNFSFEFGKNVLVLQSNTFHMQGLMIAVSKQIIAIIVPLVKSMHQYQVAINYATEWYTNSFKRASQQLAKN